MRAFFRMGPFVGRHRDVEFRQAGPEAKAN